MKMEMRLSILFIYLVIFQSCFCLEEPSCSKYHFEEKVLEKVVRFEHKMEIITETINDISGKVKDDIATMKTELETQIFEQTNSFNKLSEKLEQQMTDLTQNISTQWNTIKNDFEMIKHDAEEQKTRLNITIQKELSSLRSSFEHLSAKVQQPSYAFSAYDLLAASGPSTGTILVFAKTHINENSVYNTATGKFTAPVDGVFVFHATLHVNVRKKYIHVEFNAGGKAIGRYMVGDNYYDASSSGSAIAQLQKGTEVYLKVTSGNSGITFREDIYGMSTFSGNLLSS